MPELPDIVAYVEALDERITGQPLLGVRLASPFLLRTAVPPLSQVHGHTVTAIERLGKRVVLRLSEDLALVIHLMIAGRFRWLPRDEGGPAAKIPGKVGLAAFDFPVGTLILTEASTKRRASLHVLSGDASLRAMDPGGMDVLASTPRAFTAALRKERHTLKRTLTDPRLYSGIGNAFSDEILHRAGLSPVRMSDALDDDEAKRLHASTKAVLKEWTQRLRKERAGGFPEKVTAFREGFAVHGKFGQPCPVCGTKVQRIRYAENETNYCARCQTGGKLLADRSLSRLLRDDWPKTIDELG